MALMKCAECGQDVSDQALACPHCGFPVKAAEKEADQSSGPIGQIGPGQKFVLLTVAAALVAAVIWFGNKPGPDPVGVTPLDGSQIAPARVAEYIQKMGEEKYKAEIDRLNELPRLTAQQLLREYEANEIAADQKFGGAEIILSAQVAAISKSLTGAPRLILQGGEQTKGNSG